MSRALKFWIFTSEEIDPNKYSLDLVAEETELFSELTEQVIISALYKAFAAGREMDTEDILEASREIVLIVTMDDKLKDLREWLATS